MSRLARLRRILFRTVTILVLLALVPLVGLRFYLRSGRAARMVEDQIGAALGVPVEVEAAEIHFYGESSVSNLRLIDPDDGRPFLQSRQAVADLSVLRYLRGGTSPREIDLLEGHLRLRFDSSGNLLTKLPVSPSTGGPMPAMRIRAATLTLEQQGRAPFTLEGLSITLQPKRQDNLFGVLDDPVWGSFDLRGRLDESVFSIALQSSGVALSSKMLESLPFVPPSLWKTIRADGASVPLTFTLAVATQAPWVSYTVVFDQTRITLPQPDRKPLVVSPARGRLQGNEDGFKLDGVVADSFWGDWTVHADLVASTGAINLDLRTREAVVDQKKLEALPYVPKNVWRQVQASGRTTAHVQVGLFTNKPEVHYRVELNPKDTSVYVSSIELSAKDAAGGVVVEDARVHLSKVVGRTAGGVITTSGELDFRGDPKLFFDINVRGLILKDLPKKWELPAQIEGKITGQAKLTVTVRDGVPLTLGTGKGRIDEVKVAGFRANGPIELNLAADGKTFRFIPRSPLLHALIYAAAPESTTPPERSTLSPQPPKHPHPPTPSPKQGEGERSNPSPRSGEEEQDRSNPRLGKHLSLLTPPLRFREGVGGRGSSSPPRPPATLQPARLLGQTISAVATMTNWIVDRASAALIRAARIDSPLPADGSPPAYLDATVRVDDVDLAALIERLGLDLPIELTGRLSFELTVGIPINTARDFKAYRLQGAATLSTLTVSAKAGQPLQMTRVKAEIDYANGLLRLQQFSGELPGPDGKTGAFSGSARVALLPRGDLSFDLTVRDLPVDRLLRPLPALAGHASGALSGVIRAAAPLERLQDPVAWRGTASLRAALLELWGTNLGDFSANATLLRGLAAASDIKGDFHGAPLHGSAVLSLVGAQRFSGTLRLRGLDVGRLATLLPASWSGLAARGAVEASAEFRGGLQPLSVAGSGTLRTGPVHLAGVQLDRLALSWALADWKFKVVDLEAAIAKGKVTGTAVIPLAGMPASMDRPPGETNRHARVDLRITGVDLHTLAAAYKDLPFRVSGEASGTLVGSYTPPSAGKSGTWTGEADLSAATLRIQNIAAQKLRGRLEYQGGKATYHLEGETLGGKLSIEGKLPPPPMSSVDRFDGRLRVENVLLGRLWPSLGLRERLGGLHGVLSLDLPFRHEGISLAPVGQGRFELRSLRYAGSELGNGIRGDIRLSAEGVTVRDVSAELANGELRFTLSYRWGHPSRGWFTITLMQAEASKLLVSAARELVQGPIDVHLRGTLGPEWRGSGAMELQRGKVLGVEVAEWRIPVDFTFVPSRGHGDLTVHESSAKLGNGRAQLKSSITWGGGMRIEGGLRLIDASLASLAGMLGEASSYARGRVSGQVDFAGADMRSLNDLTATTRMTLNDAQALQLPILNQLTPYLMPGQSASTFHTGELKARLGGGVWRIEELTLESGLAQLMFQGSLTVQGGLDLDVVARTSSLGGVNPLVLRVLLTKLPPIGPVPVGLIFQATELFSNRIIRLHITGTTKAPHIQVEPLRVLSGEGARFFLTRTLLPVK